MTHPRTRYRPSIPLLPDLARTIIIASIMGPVMIGLLVWFERNRAHDAYAVPTMLTIGLLPLALLIRSWLRRSPEWLYTILFGMLYTAVIIVLLGIAGSTGQGFTEFAMIIIFGMFFGFWIGGIASLIFIALFTTIGGRTLRHPRDRCWICHHAMDPAVVDQLAAMDVDPDLATAPLARDDTGQPLGCSECGEPYRAAHAPPPRLTPPSRLDNDTWIKLTVITLASAAFLTAILGTLQ